MRINVLLYYNEKNRKSLDILFTKKEFDAIKNYFDWVKVDNYVTQSVDSFLEKEFEILYRFFPNLKEINVEQYEQIRWDDFEINSYFIKKENKFDVSQIYPRAIENKFDDFFVPLNGRQIFDNEMYINIWYNELGVYEKIRKKDKISLGFYNVKNDNFLFKNKEDSKKFLKHKLYLINKFKTDKTVKSYSNFIRVISVYDKKTKILKYQILNGTFNIDLMCEFIKCYEGDEFYLRAYKINKKLSEIFTLYTHSGLDFDFDKNVYFFETVDSKPFYYSYKDFLKNLKFIEEC